MEVEDLEKTCAVPCSKPCNTKCTLRKVQANRTAGPWYDNVYDVVIIGAGVIGCSVARRLAQYQLKICVLDKAEDVAQGASKANSGIVHGGYDEKHGTLKAKLSGRGRSMFSQLNSELNFGFRQCGSLVVAYNDEEVQALKDLQQNGVLNGVHTQMLSRDEILAKEPNVNPEVVAGIFCSESGVTSPYEYTIALIENAVANGVQLELEQEVTDITKVDDHFIITTNKDYFKTNFVVNCAGLYSDKIAAMVGGEYSIHPVKGEYIILNKSQGPLVNSTIFHVPTPKYGKGVLVSRTYWGNLLLGPTARNTDKNTPFMSNEDVLKFIIHTTRKLVPGFDVKEAITSYAGLRAKLSHGDWVIEVAQTAKNFINCVGIDSPGLTASPAVAELVETLLVGCGAQLVINPLFNPIRHSIIIDKRGMTEEEIAALGEITCRCERVTKQEILEAIHRGLPVASTDAVKKRTRAGMGQCQGTYCGPRVVKLIAEETGLPENKIATRGKGTSLLPHMRVLSADKEFLSKL